RRPSVGLYDCRNFPAPDLAPAQLWEDYCFESLDVLEGQLQQSRRLSFAVPSGAEVGGLLLWMRTELAEGIEIDTRRDFTSWNQYYLHLEPQRVDGELVVSVDVDARTEDVSYEFQVGSRFFSTKTTKREAPRPFAAKPSC
ncbi:unnamed protein product, partial [Effrenium voratum]